MIKQRAIIEVEINGRQFRMECPNEANIQEVLSACEKVTHICNEMIKTALDKQQIQEEANVE